MPLLDQSLLTADMTFDMKAWRKAGQWLVCVHVHLLLRAHGVTGAKILAAWDYTSPELVKEVPTY